MATEDFLSRQAFSASISAINVALTNVQQVEVALQPVTNNITELLQVASNVNVIVPVGENIDAVTNVDGALGLINAVNSNITIITNVESELVAITNVDNALDSITNVDAIRGEILAVDANSENINTVAGSITNVNAVGGNIGAVIGVNDNATNINAIIDNLDLLQNVASNINVIESVNEIRPQIIALGGAVSNINIVADNIDAINTVASNINAIIEANVVALSNRINAVEINVDALQGEVSNINVELGEKIPKSNITNTLNINVEGFVLDARLGDVILAKSDTVDNLTSTDTDKPLSANQGRVLNETKFNKSNFDEADPEGTFTDSDTLFKRVSGVWKKFTWANLKDAIVDFLGIDNGTWTPSIRGASTSGDYTLSISNNWFEKNGNICTAHADFTVSDVVQAGSGTLIIEGIPLNYPANNGFIEGSVRLINISTSASNTYNAFIINRLATASDQLSIGLSIEGGSSRFLNITDISAGSRIILKITYKVQ